MLIILKEFYYDKILTQVWSMLPYVLYTSSRTSGIGLSANYNILDPENEASLSVVFLHIFSGWQL